MLFLRKFFTASIVHVKSSFARCKIARLQDTVYNEVNKVNKSTKLKIKYTLCTDIGQTDNGQNGQMGVFNQ